MDRKHLQWIADTINKVYKEKGYTLEELVARTEQAEYENPEKYKASSRSNLIKIRKCETDEPRTTTLTAIAHALDLPDDYFLPTVRTMDEQAIHKYAMDYLLTHQINTDQPLDDVINDVLYETYDINPQPLITYLKSKGYEIEYDVVDNILLLEAEKKLVHIKQSRKENPKITKQYEEEILSLEKELEKCPVPKEQDMYMQNEDRFYELHALLQEKKLQYNDYRNYHSTSVLPYEIHYQAKETAINTALAHGNALKDIPIIARVTQLPVYKDENCEEQLVFPPVEMSLYKFTEATQQIDSLVNFIFQP